MAHVFISYAHHDELFVRELKRQLKAAQFSVWTDEQLTGGSIWSEIVRDQINDAFAVIVVISPSSMESNYVTFEWSYAMGRDIPIMPILFQSTDRIHPNLEALQFLDFSRPYQEPWGELIDLLRRLQTQHTLPKVRREETLVSQQDPQAFLSYSRKDLEKMQHIKQDLEDSGFIMWTDEQLEPGTPSWQKAIEHAIETVKAFVILMSPDSKESIWVERELTYARVNRCTIIPVLIAGEDSNAIPLSLINAQRIDIVNKDYENELSKLVRAIQTEIRK